MRAHRTMRGMVFLSFGQTLSAAPAKADAYKAKEANIEQMPIRMSQTMRTCRACRGGQAWQLDRLGWSQLARIPERRVRSRIQELRSRGGSRHWNKNTFR